MATLYRKYRPSNFKEIVGQKHIKTTLEEEVRSGHLAHAYLFCGPRAVGKTTLARVLAKAVNCEKRKNNDSEPCGRCRSCEEIPIGKSLDVVEIDAASHTGVDNVRENIIASSRLAPSSAKFKIFIIDEVHMLSAASFNALLKTLEEPPAHAIFILCTTEAHKVPATIISRCQRFDFKRIGVNDLVGKLQYIAREEKIEIDKNILESIARYADGHMRDAESLLGQIVAIGGRKITAEEAELVIPRSDLGEVINLISFFANKDAAGALALINRIVGEGIDLKSFVADLVETLRKAVFIKINPSLSGRLGLEMGEGLEIKLGEAIGSLGLEQLIAYLEEIIRAGRELKDSHLPQMALEIAAVKICSGLLVRPVAVASQLPIRPSAPYSSVRPGAGEAKEGDKPSSPRVYPSAGIIKLEEVIEKWPEVLAKIKKYNHSLSFILRVCQPKGLDGSKLFLAFKYKLHKERVNEAGIKAIVEKVLSEVHGSVLAIEALVDESLEMQAPAVQAAEETVLAEKIEAEKEKEEDHGAGDLISNLLKNFGGKIVN